MKKKLTPMNKQRSKEVELHERKRKKLFERIQINNKFLETAGVKKTLSERMLLEPKKKFYLDKMDRAFDDMLNDLASDAEMDDKQFEKIVNVSRKYFDAALAQLGKIK